MEQSTSRETFIHKKFPVFYGTVDLLPCSQEPATGSYPETD